MKPICPHCKSMGLNEWDQQCYKCGWYYSVPYQPQTQDYYEQAAYYQHHKQANMQRSEIQSQQYYDQAAYNQNHYYMNHQQPPEQPQGYISKTDLLAYFALFLGIIGSLLIIIGLFVPLYTASAFGYSESVTLFQRNVDWILIGSFALAVIASCINIEKPKPLLMELFTFCAIGIFIYDCSGVEKRIDSNEFSGLVHRSVGWYLIVVGAVLAVIGALFFHEVKAQRKNTL